MKSQGKHLVEFRTYINRNVHNSVNFTRTVYSNKAGEYFINYIGNKKKIHQTPQGFVAEFYVSSIKTYTIDDVISTIQQKLGVK